MTPAGHDDATPSRGQRLVATPMPSLTHMDVPQPWVRAADQARVAPRVAEKLT